MYIFIFIYIYSYVIYKAKLKNELTLNRKKNTVFQLLHCISSFFLVIISCTLFSDQESKSESLEKAERYCNSQKSLFSFDLGLVHFLV